MAQNDQSRTRRILRLRPPFAGAKGHLAARLAIPPLLIFNLLLTCCHSGWPLRLPREAALHRLEVLRLDYNQKAFIEAAGKGDIEAVSLYLDAGIDPNGEDKSLVAGASDDPFKIIGFQDVTALDAATSRNQVKMIRFLAARGADPNLPTGWTPLFNAAFGADATTVKTLLDCGANPNAVDYFGNPVAWWAISSEPPEGRGKREYTRRYTDCLRELLERGADVNAKNARGETLLIHAATFSGPETVGLLIEKGADLKAVDEAGQRAKQRAVEGGEQEIVALLEKAGG